jgi:hypothetical protein
MTSQTSSQEIGLLAEALSKAQAVIEGAKEDSVNPFFKSKYADLASVWTACKRPLSANGLCILQTIENTEDRIFLVTTLAHSSGQWIKSQMPILMTKQDPQALGSAITYCRRYALAAMVGVCPADDDAEDAMRSARKPEIATIGKAQIEEIEKLLGDRQELRKRLLEWAGVNAISEIPATKYQSVIKSIETKIASERTG